MMTQGVQTGPTSSAGRAGAVGWHGQAGPGHDPVLGVRKAADGLGWHGGEEDLGGAWGGQVGSQTRLGRIQGADGPVFCESYICWP
eukprot:11035089-Alexandrium_andersonii.AAC.1